MSYCFDSDTTSFDFYPENITQVVSRPSTSSELDTTLERTTVTPQEIFYDYDDVMARMEAERAALMEDSDDFEESYYRCSDTESVDPMETSTARSSPQSIITFSDSTSYSNRPRLPSFKPKKRQNNNRKPLQRRPSNPNPCGSSPTPSTPPRPLKSRLSCGKSGKKALKKPHRMRVRGNAQHHRKFDLSEVDLTTPSVQCTYVHPVRSEQCRSRNEVPIDWTKEAHYWTHVVQEYRMMQRKALVIGEGTIITSPEMYQELGNRVIICDICGRVLSRRDVLTRHKARVHTVERETETATGTEDGPSSSP
ncbi:hypothetical protein Clacol_008783 [Clathrus columnatus]|uniref:C2H2-type domain-containing protein n=1 Tax=Clathrus columnatus TaxID=1419009 RepID=A0AAV5AIR2_9AGAM|nr:hypothetical protein Clacol_008783 [Clathrus columnatus]